MVHAAIPPVNRPPSIPPDHHRPPFAPALIPPIATAAAVLALLGIARVYDSLPIQAPPCGLRTLTGIPCLGCGGTRAMKALAHGDVRSALSFNPLVVTAVCAALIWLGASWIRHRYFPGARLGRPIPVPWIVTGLIAAFAANWAYLILYLPE